MATYPKVIDFNSFIKEQEIKQAAKAEADKGHLQINALSPKAFHFIVEWHSRMFIVSFYGEDEENDAECVFEIGNVMTDLELSQEIIDLTRNHFHQRHDIDPNDSARQLAFAINSASKNKE